MMSLQTDIPPALYDDEVVLFIADRYHLTPREMLQRFVAQERHGMAAASGAFQLEANEMAILRDMMAAYHS